MKTETPIVAWRRVDPLPLSPLLLAALEVLHEYGFHGASVRDIAKRAGVTVPTLYYHHGNKQGILVALLETAVADVTRRGHEAVAAAGPAPVEQFTNLIEAIVLHMTRRSDIAFLDSELRYLEDAERKHYAQQRKEIESLLIQVMTDGCDDGDFTVPDIAGTARALLGMCQSIVMWYRLDRTQAPEAVIDLYVQIALQTVGKGL